MTREWDDTRLREAFRALSESEAGLEVDVDTVRVWKAVAGELDPEERREVIERVALEPGYAEAWRLAKELFEASGGSIASRTELVGSTTPRRRGILGVHYGWALAAVLVMGLLGLILPRVLVPPVPVYRGGPIVALSGVEESLPREDFRLRWEAPPGARFDVRVTTEDLQILDTASDLSSPEYLVPAERLAALPRGAKVLWQVDATLGDGSTVQSETFIAEIE